MAHRTLRKHSPTRSGGRPKSAPSIPVDPRSAFEASARLGLVRKALRQS